MLISFFSQLVFLPPLAQVPNTSNPGQTETILELTIQTFPEHGASLQLKALSKQYIGPFLKILTGFFYWPRSSHSSGSELALRLPQLYLLSIPPAAQPAFVHTAPSLASIPLFPTYSNPTHPQRAQIPPGLEAPPGQNRAS